MVVYVAVSVVPAAAIAMVIWPTKWTPRRGHHSARCAADYSTEGAADHRSANRARRRARSLNGGGAAGQGQGRQHYERKLVQMQISISRPWIRLCGGYRGRLAEAKKLS